LTDSEEAEHPYEHQGDSNDQNKHEDEQIQQQDQTQSEVQDDIHRPNHLDETSTSGNRNDLNQSVSISMITAKKIEITSIQEDVQRFQEGGS
jgi:hypothetical protein